MANLNETDTWEDGVYQLEEDDPVLGGPSGIDNVAPRQLANRTRYQRLRNITPWVSTLPYPAQVAYVSHGDTTWKSVAASTNVEPGTDATKWVRWGHTADELSQALDGSVSMHEAKANPHPQYAKAIEFNAHVADPNPHPQYATDVDLANHAAAADPHAVYAFRGAFAAVPAAYVGHVITVSAPHLRQMVWNGTAYVRAPWHQPALVLYSYDNPATIPGHLPIRADVSYSQANYPDLVARLGLSGAGTFSLIELRGEFIRCLDNGRGVDAGRTLRSGQAADNQSHAHGVVDPAHAHGVYDAGHAHGAWTDAQGAHSHNVLVFRANDFNSGGRVTGTDDVHDGGTWVPGTDTAGLHGHNVGIAAAGTGVAIYASATGISVGASGSEARPRNVAFPAWISY